MNGVEFVADAKRGNEPEPRKDPDVATTAMRFRTLQGSGSTLGSRVTRRTRSLRPRPLHQRGWIGLVALLLALAIVGWLAMSALKGHGVSGKPAATAPGTPPTDPRERARAAEATVIDRARETARQVDEAEKP